MLCMQFVAEWEQRVLKQEQIIAQLKIKGKLTREAEAELESHKRTLLQLRNNAALSRDLLKEDRPLGPKSISD